MGWCTSEKKKNEVEKIPQPSGWRMVLFPLKLQGKTKVAYC